MSVDFSPYQAVLLDLDGTIYHEDQALPGAIALIRRLQADQQPFACLSNSTSSPMRLMERLHRMGVDVDPNSIYTAAAATCDYVVQHFPAPISGDDDGDARQGEIPDRNPRVFNLATEAIDEMLAGMVDWAQTGGEPCDAVICGALGNVYATEERQRTALQLLRKGAALLGICADRVFPSPRGLEFGAGAHTWMLAYAAGVRPTFCGKPEKVFFHELCSRLKLDPQACILIGDNLEADIAGAKRVGMRTILTLSGISRRSDVTAAADDHQPDLIVEDLVELL